MPGRGKRPSASGQDEAAISFSAFQRVIAHLSARANSLERQLQAGSEAASEALSEALQRFIADHLTRE